jgi:GH25 family lysozyme M1 (1,4-beta-N-acetylmuramidase)
LVRRIALLSACLCAAATAAPAGAFVRGVDVSHWRGRVDWTSVRAGGYRFAFTEATNGLGLDWTYARNRAGAKGAGLAFGAFHMGRPSGAGARGVVADAVAEADFFVSAAQPQTGELAPVLDLEQTGGLSPAYLRLWASAWLDEVWHQVGIRPTIYTSPSFWRRSLRDASVFAALGSRLWVAHWHVAAPRVPAANWDASGWSFWQWTNCSHVRGIRGCSDGDRFRGGGIAGAVMAPPPLSIEPPTIVGVPQTGQLLDASPGTWQAPTMPVLSYQWERCTDTTAEHCVTIPLATTSTYTVMPADAGSTVRVVVGATSRGRWAWQASTAVPVNA